MSNIKGAGGGNVNPWYSGPSTWVENHLRNVLDVPDDENIVTFDLARDGVAKLGVNPDVRGGFAAQIFAVAGNALASKTTSGQFVPPVVILDQAGLNHASSNAGIVRPDGQIDQEQLAALKSFAKGKDHLTQGDLRDFLWARFFDLQSGKMPLGERLRRVLGNLVLSRGEFGPLFAVASIENPDKKGQRILPLERIDEFYDNKLFTRIRAEREAAMIVSGAEVHDGPKGVAGALAKFARENGGPSTGNPADLAKYAADLLQGRTESDVARLRDGFGIFSVAGPSVGTLMPNAKAMALALCPAFRGSMPAPPPAGQLKSGGLPENQERLNRIFDQAPRPLDPVKDADAFAVVQESRKTGDFGQLFNPGGVGFKCFFKELPDGRFVTWPAIWKTDVPPYTLRSPAEA